MILDLQHFVTQGRPVWSELESLLDRLERDPERQMDLPEVRRFHTLYRRTSADLARVATSSAEPEVRRYLESLVARAYGEVHEVRGRPHRLRPLGWFTRTFPRTFRRHLGAFAIAAGITLLGSAFGAVAVLLDADAKAALLPFQHLLGDPAERVAHEESRVSDPLQGNQAAFAAQLMTHNTQVSITVLALGVTFGAGTCLVLFANGVILGAVVLDYLRAGQAKFLAGWLLPHGSVEIPAILLAGQAGLVLGMTLLGAGGRGTARERLRAVGPDLVTLIGGVAVLLVWAGFVEAFLSQAHEPALPYTVKIAFGAAELGALVLFLAFAGRAEEGQEDRARDPDGQRDPYRKAAARRAARRRA